MGLKYEEYIKWRVETKGPANMTGNQAIFTEELINAIEDSADLKKAMVQVGSRKHVFEDIQEWYREVDRTSEFKKM